MLVSRYIGLSILILTCAIPGFTRHKSFTIAKSGKSMAAIVISADAPIAEHTAASELSTYLKQITGADFPVYSPATCPSGKPRIFVGQSKESTKLLGNINWSKLKYDGIIIKFVGDDLVLAGDRPRGSLYAVYTFLEDYLACRWWTADANHIPFNQNLSVKRTDKTHIPPFMYREVFYCPVIRKSFGFASRLKLNGTHQPVPDEYGGHYSIIGTAHTADRFLPASVYLDTHPEWFSLVNGKRIGGQTTGQLCLTNADMKTEFIKNVLKEIETNPSAGIIAIDQNDNFNYCQCDNCNAVAKEEGGQSGVLLRFVNSVAYAIGKKYPDFLIEMLAYTYTRHAPKLVKPGNNVIIRLCSIECDFASPLDSKTNASFYRDLLEWKKITKRLYVWDYVVNFANLSINHPNWRVLAPNIRIFTANNVVGLFEQGDGFNNDAAFGNMKIWVVSHLMWDPTLDTHKLMKEFADGYYGPAAPYLIDYIDMTSNAIEKSGMQLGCFAGANFDYMKQKEMDIANDLFDKAERSVLNNKELLDRVRIERLALDHTWILQTFLNRSKVGKARGMDMKAVCEDFISRSDTSGNKYVMEYGPMTADYNSSLLSFAALPYIPEAKRSATTPVAVKGLKSNQWVDIQDNEMNLYLPGIKSFFVEDKDASDGRAIRMPGSQLDWAVAMHLDKTAIKPGTEVTVYVRVKAILQTASGVAFTTGIYDKIGSKVILDRSIMAEDMKDSEYNDYNLGTYKLEPGWYIYVASPGDDKLVSDVFVDRGFVTKAN